MSTEDNTADEAEVPERILCLPISDESINLSLRARQCVEMACDAIRLKNPTVRDMLKLPVRHLKEWGKADSKMIAQMIRAVDQLKDLAAKIRKGGA